MSKRWWRLVIIILMLGMATSCRAREELSLRDIAQKLGIEPNLNALAEYVGSRLEIGMSREEVHKEFEKIGPYELEQKTVFPPRYHACEEVVFKFTLGVYLRISLCYDDSARLVQWERLDLP